MRVLDECPEKVPVVLSWAQEPDTGIGMITMLPVLYEMLPPMLLPSALRALMLTWRVQQTAHMPGGTL